MFPHLLRFGVGFGGGFATLLVLFATLPWPLALAIALPVFLICSAIAEWLFRRYATRDQIIRDLEDRTRNPPD